MKSGIAICHGTGFHLKFENGWVLSVQCGPGMYCEHHNDALPAFTLAPTEPRLWESKDAEIAVWNSGIEEHKMVDLGSDSVKGWVTVSDLAKVIGVVYELKPETTNEEASSLLVALGREH